MTLRGIIENGRIVVEGGELPPEGTRVDVTVRRSSRGKKKRDSLADLARYAVSTGIKDLSDQHDHYAYGTPKRKSKKARARTGKSPRRGARS